VSAITLCFGSSSAIQEDDSEHICVIQTAHFKLGRGRYTQPMGRAGTEVQPGPVPRFSQGRYRGSARAGTEVQPEPWFSEPCCLNSNNTETTAVAVNTMNKEPSISFHNDLQHERQPKYDDQELSPRDPQGCMCADRQRQQMPSAPFWTLSLLGRVDDGIAEGWISERRGAVGSLFLISSWPKRSVLKSYPFRDT